MALSRMQDLCTELSNVGVLAARANTGSGTDSRHTASRLPRAHPSQLVSGYAHTYKQTSSNHTITVGFVVFSAMCLYERVQCTFLGPSKACNGGMED